MWTQLCAARESELHTASPFSSPVSAHVGTLTAAVNKLISKHSPSCSEVRHPQIDFDRRTSPALEDRR